MPGTVEAPETVQAATSASQGDRMFQTLYPELSEFPNDNGKNRHLLLTHVTA